MRAELLGQRFGQLTVVALHPHRSASSRALWVCLCDCGNQRITDTSSLKRGSAKSCGCLTLRNLRERSITHGKTNTRAYHAWFSMRQRCYYRRNKEYHNYGERGIEVCSEWREEFEAFYMDMGDPPDGMTLDRIDVEGNYNKETCRWATVKEQARNRRNNRLLTLDGEEHCVAEWAEIVGISSHTLLKRLDAGWSLDRVLRTPVRPIKRWRNVD